MISPSPWEDGSRRPPQDKGADVSGPKFPLLKGPYLGQPEPEDKPRAFALDIVSTRHMIHGGVVFTPDGREAYWSGSYPAAGSDDPDYQILMMEQEQGTWGAPRLAPFCRVEYQDDCPFITPDGKGLLPFPEAPRAGRASGRPREYLDRRTKGRRMGGAGIPGGRDQLASGALAGLDGPRRQPLFRRPGPRGEDDGRHLRLPTRGRTLPEAGEAGPGRLVGRLRAFALIAPDGSYIIFSRASQQRGQLGLFISFKKKDGQWGDAICLNEVVGCPTASQCTSVTPDGKYLFYVSWGFEQWAAYWVKSDVIEKLRPKD